MTRFRPRGSTRRVTHSDDGRDDEFDRANLPLIERMFDAWVYEPRVRQIVFLVGDAMATLALVVLGLSAGFTRGLLFFFVLLQACTAFNVWLLPRVKRRPHVRR